MKSSDQVVKIVRRALERAGSRDDVLKEAVRILKQEREQYDWVGIYLLEGDMLVLHNYIGKPTEHTHIKVGQGVCGVAVSEGANQIIGDVTKLDNYLACSLETRSEIVVLIRHDSRILGQIDIDSDLVDAFDYQDENLLTEVAELIAPRIQPT